MKHSAWHRERGRAWFRQMTCSLLKLVLIRSQLLVRQPAARIAGAEDLHGVTATFDESDFALLIDDKGHTISDAVIRKVDAVCFGYLTIHEIA